MSQEQSQSGTYTAYEVEYFDGKWKKISRTENSHGIGMSNASESRRSINSEIDLLSYPQAQGIIWMVKCENCMKYFITRIVPYKVEYKITFTVKKEESLNIKGVNEHIVFSKGLIGACEK